MSGLTNLTGTKGGPPLHSNFPIGDAVAGLFCAFAIAAEVARLRRSPEERGAEVDLSATEALFRFMDPLPVEYERLGQIRTREGNTAGYTAPSDMYESSDGVYFSLVASSNAIFVRLCRCIGKPEWGADPRFANNRARVANVEELNEGLRDWFSSHSFDEISRTLQAESVPFSKIYTIEDIVHDPHYVAREAIIRLPDEDYGTLPAPCVVPRVAGRETPIPRTGPDVGEHNAEVYRELGFSEGEMEALRKKGVV